MENEEKIPQQIHLYKTAEGSNKEYILKLRSVGNDLWIVESYYGKRGKVSSSAILSKPPYIEYDKALKLYNKTVYTKKRNLYTENECGYYTNDLEKESAVSAVKLERKFAKHIMEYENSAL